MRPRRQARAPVSVVVFGVLLAMTPMSASGGADSVARTFKPGRCQGWVNARAAAEINLTRAAKFSEFTEKNSAVLRQTPARAGAPGTAPADSELTCDGFSGEGFPDEATLDDAVVSISLAVSGAPDSSDVLIPAFSLDDGATWTTTETLVVRDQVSNATREGYWRLAFPGGLQAKALPRLRFRLQYNSGADNFADSAVFVDGLALSVRVAKQPSGLKKFFNVSESPTVVIDEASLKNIEILGPDGQAITTPFETVVKDGKTTLQFQRGLSLPPGQYIVRTKSKKFYHTVTTENVFSFGVLNLNTAKSIYEPGDLIALTMGVLDSRGRTVCDARLTLTIQKPDNQVLSFATADASITHSAECGAESLTSLPDYSATILADQVGNYTATLVVQTDAGPQQVQRTFAVQTEVHPVFERLGPTRINPRVPYTMRLRITPTENFTGEVVESLPSGFKISGVTPAGEVQTNADRVTVHWSVNWQAFQTYELSYAFDAPDVSPALFTIGPFQAGSEREPQPWTMTSDEVIKKEKEDLQVEALPITDAEWAVDRSDLVEPTQPVFKSWENVHIKAYKRGYRLRQADVPSGLRGATNLTVAQVEVFGPEHSVVTAAHVSENFRRGGQDLEILHLVPNSQLRPGIYTITSTLSDGQRTVTEETTFAWGVVAVNTDRSVYHPGETAGIGLGMVDAIGKTVCDAEATVTVTPPQGAPLVLQTEDGTIQRSDECGPITVTNTPDYHGDVQLGEVGEYGLTVTATIKGTSFTTTDTIHVQADIPFVIVRSAPTRVFPAADYDLAFAVTPTADYQGTFEEALPATYGVVTVGQGGKEVAATDTTKKIRWTVDWKSGQTYALTYRLDPQDISPALFRLGPAKVGDFTEFRQWQIASDALITVSGTVYSNEGTTAFDCSATNLTINVRVNGGGTASATCTAANGTYSVGSVSVSAAADVITTYIDANASVRAVTVSRAADATSNITGLDLYQNFVITRHEDAGPITNTNLDQFDSGNDADVQLTVTAGALTLLSGQALHVWTGDSFSPGGTVTTNVTGGNVHINSSATLTAGGNLSIGGSWDNDGTFTASTYTATFTSTSAGRTLSGTLNGSSAFYKVNFNGTGGEWTIQDSMIVSAANATDTFVMSAGTATFGDSNGDTLEINGMMTIANTANQTATFQTAALSQGSTVTIDVNNNASPATCANCLIRVGASSGTGTGTLKIRKNALVRLNARSTATVSDAGIEGLSTGYVEIQGSQDDTGTSNGTTNETTLTDTSKSWTTDQHANKVVRITNTSSLAFGKVYAITANTATALTRADNSTASATVQSVITTEAETKVKIICANVNSLITANNEATGRYINDQTGTTGQLLIVASTNNSASCTGSTDLFVVYPSPDALSVLAASDTFDIVDGVRANDTFEILDYAHVTAEAGTACNAAVNSSGEGYIYNVAGSETLIQYAEICNLGRNASTRTGVETSTVNGNNAGEGILINKSDIHHNYRGIRFVSNSNNSSANTEGVTNSLLHDNTQYGLELFSSDNVYAAYNRSYDNTSIGMTVGSGSDSSTFTGNYSYSNSSFGFSFASTGHTVTSNYAFENATENFDFNGNTMTVSSNMAYGGTTYGFFGNFLYNSTLSSNTAVRNSYGIRLQNGSNDVISSNTTVSNPGYGIFLSNTNDNTLIYSNTVVDNGSRGINIQNTVGTIAFSNTVSNNDTGISGGYGLYFESSSGSGTDNNTFFNNDLYGEDTGMFVQYSVAGTGNRFINEDYGVTSANSFDLRFDSTGAHQFELYNTRLNSTNEFNGAMSNGSVISRLHDGTNGAVRVWNDYSIPSNNAETPQTESTEQYNYANGLWSDSITPHTYKVGYGAGTEDTDIQLAFSGAMGGDTGVYGYRVVCNAANCVTTGSSWDVYRNETLLTAKASTGTTYTDSQVDGASAPNVQFTIGDAGTDYTAGATYTFVAWKGATDTNTQKTVKMMQDVDTFTVPSGTTLQLKGQSAGTNVTQVQRNTAGGYSFIVGGTIDADAYSFNHLGGTGQASGLDINSGATITSLDNGSFDNFATNVGTADSFIDIDSSIISTGTPSNVFDAIAFVNTGSNANCAVNATGADAAGYIQFTGSTGTFGTESNDCNDGVADADPGQIKWGGIRIKGTVYSDEGSTAYNCSTDNLTINVSVNGGANTAVTCTAAGGTYTIAAAAPSAAADPIVISIDSVETPDATTATLAASTTAAISGLNLYQNRLIVRHEDAGPMSNAKLSTGDNADAGIRYAVSAGALTVESGIELHVWTSKTFTPGGTVTTQGTGDLHVDDSATATLDTATSAIARDITVDTGATLNINATSTVDGGDITTGGTGVVATSGTPTVTIRGTGNIGGGSGAITFYALTVGDATTATSTAASSFTVNNTLTVGASSTLSINSGINVTSGTSGTVTINGTISGAGTLVVQNSNLGTGGTLSSVVRFDATSADITMPNRTYGGNVDVYSSSSSAARVVTMAAGTHTLSAALSLNAADSQNVTLAGATNNPTVNLTSNLTYTNGGAGTEIITSGTGTWTVSGNVDFSNGTYTATSGNTLVMNGSSRTLTSNGQTLQNLTLSGTITLANATHTVAGVLDMTSGTITAGSSTVTMTGTANLIGAGNTLNNLTINGSGTTVTIATSDLSVSGTLTIGGAADGDNDTLSIGSGRTVTTTTTGTVTLVGSGTDTISGAGTLKIQNSNLGTGGTVSSIVNFDSTNGNITLPARTYGGAVQVTNTGSTNRTVTGAAGTITMSSTYDSSVTSTGSATLDLDANDPTVTITGNATIGATTVLSASASASFSLGGNLTNSGTLTSNSGTTTFTATDTGNTMNPGSSSLGSVTFNGSGGEWSALTNTLTITGDLLIVAGTLNTASGSANITVNGNVQCSGTCGTINLTASGHTFTHSVAANKNFGTNVAVATDWTFYNLTFTGTSGVRTITVNGTGTGEINVSNNFSLTNSGTALTVDDNTNDRIFDVDNDVSIGSGTTFSASNSATFSVGGSWANSGTFTHNSGTVVFDSIQTTETITSGGSAFGNVEMDSGLVGYWKLDEGTGTSSVADSSRYGQAGTMVNHEAGDWNTSVENAANFGSNPSALDFDGTATGGSEEYINLGTPNQLNSDLTTQISLVANIRPSASSKLEVIIGKPHNDAKTSPFYKWLLYRTSNNAISCRIGDQLRDSVASTLTNNSWSAVGCVYDSANITVYHQGSSVGTAAQTDAIESSSTPAAIGAGTGTTITEEFTGRIDDVRIYKRALSSTEMTALHNGNHPATSTFTLQDAMDVDGNLGVRTGELDVSATNCSSSPCGLTVGGHYINVANLNSRTGTVTLDSSDAANIQADEAFYNLTVSNGGTRTLDKQRLDVDNALTLSGGTLDVSAASCSAGTSCAMEIGGGFKNWGTFVSQTGTVTMNAGSGTTTIDTSEADSQAGADFHHLTFNDGGGTAAFRPVYTLDVNGNLTVTGGTLDMTGPTTFYLTNDGGGTVNQRLLKPTNPAGSADNTAVCSDNAVQVAGYCLVNPRTSNTTWSTLPATIQQRGYMFNDGMAISGSFAAGTWSAAVTTNIVEGAYTYTTRQVCGKLWKADAALTSGTIIKDWTCATVAGVGVQDTTISFGSLASQTLSSQVVYAEFAVRLAGGIDNTSGATTATFRVNEGGTKQQLTTPAFTPHLLLGGNWTNNDLFTHASGTVVLDGSSQQTVGNGATSFSGLTVTNTSGSDPESSPSVIFSGAATTAGTFTAETASTKLRFNAGSTYTLQNISFNGQATSTRVALRSSSTGTAWNLNVAGTRSVANTDVRDSNACGQAPNIDASDGTNFDAGGNSCWDTNTLTFAISDTGIGFGSLSAAAARWASGDGTGSASDVAAHTLQITTNARNGYAITYNGATLTSGSNTISAATITDDADGTPGSEQFAVGFQTNGNATIASGYDHNATASLRDWNFVASTTTTAVSETAATATETISAYYLTNISSVTEAGAYTTTITYIATATF